MEGNIQRWRSFLRTQIDSWFADTATMEVRTWKRLEPIILFIRTDGNRDGVNFVRFANYSHRNISSK